MDASAYFETDPWTEIVQVLSRGTLGQVVEIAVQVTCLPGALDTAVQEWQQRWDTLLGAPVTRDVRRGKGVVSLLARYPKNAIVRLFADESADSPMYSIEVVGSEALLLWKPEVHPLARLSLPGGEESAFAHPYASDLAKEAVA